VLKAPSLTSSRCRAKPGLAHDQPHDRPRTSIHRACETRTPLLTLAGYEIISLHVFCIYSTASPRRYLHSLMTRAQSWNLLGLSFRQCLSSNTAYLSPAIATVFNSLSKIFSKHLHSKRHKYKCLVAALTLTR